MVCNVTVIDVVTGARRAGVTVLTQGERITAIGAKIGEQMTDGSEQLALAALALNRQAALAKQFMSAVEFQQARFGGFPRSDVARDKRKAFARFRIEEHDLNR